MTTQGIPQLNKDEAKDLGKKLQEFGKELSPTQREYLGYALKRIVADAKGDVEGYDWTLVDFQTFYYDDQGDLWEVDDYEWVWE